MHQHKDNAKWLSLLAPFRSLSISAAYLTPFFLINGLDIYQVFLLQSIFSLASLIWEIPSGYIADRYGRALSIKISAPIAAVAMIAYGLSRSFWQFVLCELLLAIANGLISGIDTALLYDSLKADGKENDFVSVSQRINSYGYAATACGVPLAILLVLFVSIRSTLIADGLLTLIGASFALQLVEAPRFSVTQEATRLSRRQEILRFGSNPQVRWLVALGSILSTATYIGFWLTAPYYQAMGIPPVFFGAILALRSLWKAWISHRCEQRRHTKINLLVYSLVAGGVFIAMASGQFWLIWLVLGHDAVQALQAQPITARLNTYIDHNSRATINSAVNLIQRLSYTIAGPLVGLVVDRFGLRGAFVATGIACSLLASIVWIRMHTLKVFE